MCCLPVVPFSESRGLVCSHLYPGHLPVGLLQCTLCGTTIEVCFEATTSTEQSNMDNSVDTSSGTHDTAVM